MNKNAKDNLKHETIERIKKHTSSPMTKYATLNCKADGWKVMIPISTVWCEGCHVLSVYKTLWVSGAKNCNHFYILLLEAFL